MTEKEVGQFYKKNDLTYFWVWCIKCPHCGQRVPLTNQMWIANTTKKKIGEDVINLAIIGMPNVGKSSLMNNILKEEKSIVTDIAGTTRDSIDSYIKYCIGQISTFEPFVVSFVRFVNFESHI